MTKTVMWSKDQCSFCTRAKQMLESKGIRYEERNISGPDWTRDQLLVELPDARTVPQIILHGTYVGGYTELAKYFEDHDMWRND